jgi:hypothetical protein
MFVRVKRTSLLQKIVKNNTKEVFKMDKQKNHDVQIFRINLFFKCYPFIRLSVCLSSCSPVRMSIRPLACLCVSCSLCFYVGMSLGLYVRMSGCSFARILVCPYVSMVICQNVSMSICQYVYMPECQYVHMPECQYVHV